MLETPPTYRGIDLSIQLKRVLEKAVTPIDLNSFYELWNTEQRTHLLDTVMVFSARKVRTLRDALMHQCSISKYERALRSRERSKAYRKSRRDDPDYNKRERERKRSEMKRKNMIFNDTTEQRDSKAMSISIALPQYLSSSNNTSYSSSYMTRPRVTHPVYQDENEVIGNKRSRDDSCSPAYKVKLDLSGIFPIQPRACDANTHNEDKTLLSSTQNECVKDISV